MENQEVRIKCFSEAVACLPPRLQNTALGIPDEQKAGCEELRLRAGQAMHATIEGHERSIGISVNAEELRETISRAARYSVHSFSDALSQGYLPLEGGHRLGVCGTVILKAGEIAGIRTIASLNLRIARQEPGSADAVIKKVLVGEVVRNTLIISPPGFGKTTLLRDLIRQLSGQGIRIAIADERGELAAMRDGIPQFDVGQQTDVMDGCPKAQGASILIKTMSPKVVALDEVTAPQDVDAIAYAGHCGVAVLATAHAVSLHDLSKRPLYKRMLDLDVFEQAILIERAGKKRNYQVVCL